MKKTSPKPIRFDDHQYNEISLYATNRGISFTEAVRELCDRALHYDFDKYYAPHIAQVVLRANERLEQTIEAMLTEITELNITETRALFNSLQEELKDIGLEEMM